MLPETFERIAASIRPYTRRLTLSAAYEPTVSPHFVEILRLAATHAFPEVRFLTNGNIMPQVLAETIVTSNVTEVCFSVHASRPHTYAHILRGGRLDRTLHNIERLLEARKALGGGRTPRIQFNIALMRSNLEELVEIIEMAARLGIDSVAFRHLIVFEGLDMESESLVNHDKRLVNASIQRALERAHELGVTISNSPDYFEIAGSDAHSQCAAWPSKRSSESRPDRLFGRIRAVLGRIRQKRVLDGLSSPRRANLILGNIDEPSENVQFSENSMELAGWALGSAGIETLYVTRDPVPEDPPSLIDGDGLVHIGVARFHNSTRDDVVRVHPNFPYAYRAGWTYVLRRSSIPSTAQPGVVLRLIALDRNGERAPIGSRNVLLRDGKGHVASLIRCHMPFDSLYFDARAHVYPYPDCHTNKPFGESLGQPFDQIWHDDRLTALRVDMVAGRAPEMCRRCPLFINREVNSDQMFEAYRDFSTEDRR